MPKVELEWNTSHSIHLSSRWTTCLLQGRRYFGHVTNTCNLGLADYSHPGHMDMAWARSTYVLFLSFDIALVKRSYPVFPANQHVETGTGNGHQLRRLGTIHNMSSRDQTNIHMRFTSNNLLPVHPMFFILVSVVFGKIMCNKQMLAFISQNCLSSFICSSLEARPSMLTATQRLKTDNSYHVANASLLASFSGFAAFQRQWRGSP